MRSTTLFTIISGFLYSGNLNAQTAIKADPGKWATHNSRATFDEGIIHLINTSDKIALLWLNNTNFKNGIVELDVKGKNVRGQSFVGVAFHGSDDETYDAIYFRPFNFRDPEKKDRAVQYINKPDNDWDVLREKHPGKYEHAVQPIPDPNEWFHVKIVIDFPGIRVYVNGSREPSLEVEKISKRGNGKLGLWIDSEDGWFKNVVITHLD
jgi:hypothetical protein